MRITKVALAFFSIGFLAGSFERAAGLGQTERSRSSQDFRINAAVMFGTAYAMASIEPFGRGLPDELRPRTLIPSAIPESVAAALPALETPSSLADRAFVRYGGPQDDWHLIPVPPLNPDLQRLDFGTKNKRSEPGRQRSSRLPSPTWMSLPPTEPFDLGPNAKGRNRQPAITATQDFIMPFERGRVTSLYHQGRYHPAIDLAGSLGTPVHATTRKQKVTFAGWRGGYGNAVIARDDLGRTHLYGHLQRIFARVGSVLEQGQKLGALGSTGHSTGPHVHYEMRAKSGAHVDPVSLLFGRRVGRGHAWNGARSVSGTRVAARADSQPRPR